MRVVILLLRLASLALWSGAVMARGAPVQMQLAVETDPEEAMQQFLSEEHIRASGVFPGENVDSDLDGVDDLNDNCPDTPNGVLVDECGCPLDLCKIDSDKDGVPDCRDDCKRTLRGLKVDPKGCPLPVKQRTRIRLDVKFSFAQANIQDRYVPDLERLKALLIRFPSLKLTLEGHTDSRGSDAYNLALSDARARICRSYILEDSRIDPSRIRTVGFGERWPIASNRSDEGRALNRRTVAEIDVEFAMRTPNDALPPAVAEGEIPLDALPAAMADAPAAVAEPVKPAAPAGVRSASPSEPPNTESPKVTPLETRTPYQIMLDSLRSPQTAPPGQQTSGDKDSSQSVGTKAVDTYKDKRVPTPLTLPIVFEEGTDKGRALTVNEIQLLKQQKESVDKSNPQLIP